jgi:uncharacterized cupin superfamily protein
MNSLFEHLLESPAGTDRLGVALVTQPRGVATPLHRHTREAEALYLLDGRMDYRAGDRERRQRLHVDGQHTATASTRDNPVSRNSALDR